MTITTSTGFAVDITSGTLGFNLPQMMRRGMSTGLMFVGFTAVLAAVSFTIARMLGVLREGGGRVQETAGAKVHTLHMPSTAKAFIGIVAMSMVTLVVAVVIHFTTATGLTAGSISPAAAETTAITLEAVRRLGVAEHLVAIALGLAAIVEVIRFQTIRLHELAGMTRR